MQATPGERLGCRSSAIAPARLTSFVRANMRTRRSRMVLWSCGGLLAAVFTWLIVSLLVIDRSQPAVIGTLPAGELKEIRRAVKSSTAEIPAYWLAHGQFQGTWDALKELYTYRILSVQVIDRDTVLVFTHTNYFAGGKRRPDFFVRRIDGVWQAAPPSPIL